jgi:hypothetical protein
MKFLKCINVELKEKCINFLKEESILISDNTIEEDTMAEINKALEELETPVYIKLNQCAPTDCNFLVHELKCFNLTDILTLIKGSEKIYENLTNLLTNGEKIFLKIMPWYKLDISKEFRCFYFNNRLRGISQRHLNYYFDYSKEEIEKLHKLIASHFSHHNDNELLKEDELIVDVICLKGDRVKIIDMITNNKRKDFNIVYYQQDYFLLFNEEKILDCSEECEIRVINSADDIVTFENHNKYPIELVENNFDIMELIKNNL